MCFGGILICRDLPAKIKGQIIHKVNGGGQVLLLFLSTARVACEKSNVITFSCLRETNWSGLHPAAGGHKPSPASKHSSALY